MRILLRNIFLVSILFTFNQDTKAQGTLGGYIHNAINQTPIPYASIGILQKNVGCVTDSAGNYVLELTTNINFDDIVIISSIGYKEKKMALHDFIREKFITLEPVERVLQDVRVTPFKNDAIIGSVTKRRNMLSGWSGSGKGGEIGNVITIDAKQYKLGSVSYYLLTGCDSVWFRLHIREFKNGRPGLELLNGNIILLATIQDGVSIHDLSKFNILITDNTQIYVSLELISRSKTIADKVLGNNVHITGHTGGILHYKWYPQTDWLTNNKYELSLMLKARY